MSGPRRLNLLRDLPAVAELLHLAFGAELRLAGASLAEDVWLARSTAPLVWLFSLLFPRFRDQFQGYVWEEDGRLVGNVSLGRLGEPGQRWMIGNVAVHPAYRRRGIARQLTQMALDHCRTEGAEVVTLEVRHDNLPAYNLYLHLGFCLTGSTTKLKLEGVAPPPYRPLPGYAPRPLAFWQWDRARALARLRAPVSMGGLKVGKPASAEPRLAGWLGSAAAGFVSGRRSYRWGLERQGMLVAYLEVRPNPERASSSLHLVVHPEFRGAVEETLVTWVLSRLAIGPREKVLAEVATADAPLLAVLHRCGFHDLEVLDTLVVGAICQSAPTTPAS